MLLKLVPGRVNPGRLIEFREFAHVEFAWWTGQVRVSRVSGEGGVAVH